MQVSRPLAKLLDCYEWCKRGDDPGGSGNLRHGALAMAVSHQLIPIVRGCVVRELSAGIIPGKDQRRTRKSLSYAQKQRRGKVTPWTWAGDEASS